LSSTLNIFFVGDIVGKPGLDLTETLLRSYLEKYSVDLCIANGENLSDGKGILSEDAERLFSLGVRVITGGNHTWDKWQTRKLLARENRILRPLNYPKENPGLGFTIVDVEGKGKVGVLNLQGRTFMQTIDCPFKAAEWAYNKIKEQTPVILLDFHAEATAEKIAMAWYLDGRVSAIIGTHTHTPTADARILPEGTAYITDVGMTGPYDSVIGMKKDIAIRRFINQTPFKYETASHDARFCGVFVQVDTQTGKALRFEQVIFPAFQ
jgi:2',3'-cyclic-nucleotide 2'-phosphodiesterase